MEGVLDFTNDMVESVNNDTKELIIGTTDRFHEVETSIEEGEETQVEGINSEKSFILPSFKMKHRGIKTDKRQENPPSMRTLDGNSPSVKSISDDIDFLENLNYWYETKL